MFDVFGLFMPKMAAFWLTNQTRRADALQMRQTNMRKPHPKNENGVYKEK